MKELIKKWFWSYKQSSKKKSAERVRIAFCVTEKNGKMYIVHHEHAVAVMPMTATAKDIAAKLEEARNAALEYEDYEGRSNQAHRC